MSVTGRDENGMVVLSPGTALKEGAEVSIEPLMSPASEDPFVQAVQRIIKDRTQREEETAPSLPDDMSVNLDYYLHGHARKQSPRTARWLGRDGKSAALTDQETASETGDLAKMAAETRNLPPDLAINHDHYLHGLPKR